MNKRAENSLEAEETKDNPKIYITHLGGHRVEPRELLRNKKVRDLIKQMARIRVSKNRRRRETSYRNNGVQRPD